MSISVFLFIFSQFSQNPELRMKLLATAGKMLALTNQDNDNFWGIGLNALDPRAKIKREWKGENVLGEVLTSVRHKMLQDRRDKGTEQMDTSTAITE